MDEKQFQDITMMSFIVFILTQYERDLSYETITKLRKIAENTPEAGYSASDAVEYLVNQKG